MDPEHNDNPADQNAEPQEPKISIGGVSSRDFSIEDESFDDTPVQQTTVRGLGTDKDGNQIEVRGLQYQAEKQETKNYTSESELEKKRLKHQNRVRQMKLTSIIVVTLIILLGVAWYLFSSV